MNQLVILPVDVTHPARTYPLMACRVVAGFPSPANDYLDEPLNIQELLVTHPASTFFMNYTARPIPSEMVNTGDILVVDKSVRPWLGALVVVCLEGEMKLRRWQENERAELAGEDWYVWGVVVGLARRLVK
ncbi:DNA repair protein [Leeia sp. TBRC 13508]|uniref:DNA repair protein n=1 Tax=Leeia speluncae TaxID=2884804 RepID=A0ABS8D8V6_9NEIS|nr:S24 family peptidase [Leeia speluncae]MCB6184658.1 DNA repair protein [Leeia speluncae]